MSVVLLEIALHIVGIFLGIWWFRHIILPLSYGLYWTVRGWARWYIPFRYLVGAVISVVLVWYLPVIAPYPLQNRFLGIGLGIGIVISIIRVFDKPARLVMRDHLADYIKPHLTLAGVGALERGARTEELTDEGRAISRQAWNDCWRHIIIYGVAVVIIIWLGRFARWLGVLLFNGLAIITLFDILRLFVVRSPGILHTLMIRRRGGPLRTETYRGMITVGFVESMILIQYTFYLYDHFFK